MPDTEYHNWTMPVVGGSVDTWGQELNTMFAEQDAAVEDRGILAARPSPTDVPDGAKFLVTAGIRAGTVYVERNDVWSTVGRLSRPLVEDPLGTLTASGDPYNDFTIDNAVNDTTTPISDVDVFPSSGQALSGEYPFHSEWVQRRDYDSGQTDVDIRVIWDTDNPPGDAPGDIDLDYIIYQGLGGLAATGAGGAWAEEADDGASLVAQDLSGISGNDGVMYRHNGNSSITANGASTSAPGYYVWSATDNEWKTAVAY